MRDQALRGELWAGKLLQKVVAALPESESESRPVDMEAIGAEFELLMKKWAREKAEAVEDPEKGDGVPDPVEHEDDE